jgi:peptide/nickel transport system substrate-binding protein
MVPASATAAPATPSPTPALPPGGSIIIGVTGDPSLEVNAMPAFLQNAVFDSLFTVDPATGALKPGLADSFQVSSDATTMTFHLRPGVRWHNGDAFSADDVVATINAFSDPKFRGTPVTDFGPLASVKALDPQTVQLTFSQAYCPALTSIGTMSILPRAVVTSANFPLLTPAQMIGTGPLKFRALNQNTLTLDPNPDYYAGAPGIHAWTLQIFSDAAALRAAFTANQVDVMPAAPGEFGAIKSIDGAKVFSTNAPELVELLFNSDTTTLNDARVRQALNYALDRNLLLNDIAGQGQWVDGSTLPGYWANGGGVPRYSFDPAQAKQILNDAGWIDSGDGVRRKNGKPMQIELWTEADNPILEPLAFRIRELYAALGIDVVLELDDRPGWVTRAFDHRFDLLLLARKLPLDPDQRWYWQSDQNAKGSGFNFGSYANPRVDAAFKSMASASSCDPAARAALFNEINRTLVTEAPAAFLFTPKQYLVARDRVVGPAPSTFAGDFWNIGAWRVKQ